MAPLGVRRGREEHGGLEMANLDFACSCGVARENDGVCDVFHAFHGASIVASARRHMRIQPVLCAHLPSARPPKIPLTIARLFSADRAALLRPFSLRVRQESLQITLHSLF
jgi:hypothetical protein